MEKNVKKKKETFSILQNKIIVIGSGKLGAQIAKNFSEKGENVLVIDKDPESLNKLEDFSGFNQVGDATDLSILESNGIKNAKTVVVTTNDDDTNLFIGDVCDVVYNVPCIFIRLNDANKNKLLEGKNVKSICPFLLSLEDFEARYKEIKK